MPNWKKLIVSNSDANLTNLTVDNAVTASFFKGDGSALVNVNANVAEVATVSDTFSSALNKTVQHNFNTKDVIVTVYNSLDQQIIPSSITTTDVNSVDIEFDIATTGRVVVAKGGHIVSGSAADSNALNGQTGDYYLNYNNHTNIPSGIISSSVQISNLTYYKESVTGSTVYTIAHNLQEDFPIVQVYDPLKQQVLPADIISTSSNEVQISFDSTFSGTVVIKK